MKCMYEYMYTYIIWFYKILWVGNILCLNKHALDMNEWLGEWVSANAKQVTDAKSKRATVRIVGD